jgi:hypothetical protein
MAGVYQNYVQNKWACRCSISLSHIRVNWTGVDYVGVSAAVFEVRIFDGIVENGVCPGNI